MRTRKPTQAEIVNSLQIELQNREQSLARLKARRFSATLTKDDLELMEAHEKWIAANKPYIRRFYAPAIR